MDNEEVNLELRDQIFEIIDNQIEANEPPETKITFKRLKNEGFDDFTTKQLIGQCVALELYDVLYSNKAFDEKRYVKNLKRLPQEPFDL